MNIWRDIPSGDKPPELLNMVVEVIMGSRDKYEYMSFSGGNPFSIYASLNSPFDIQHLI
ncbi:MAG: hypothetical protein QXK47_04485 [Candidatus Bathyarchaeia archaeon]